MISLSDISILVIEASSYCNLSCPMCSRTHPEEIMIDPNLTQNHLPLTMLASLTKDALPNLKSVIFQGDRGDAVMHPDLVNILNHFSFVETIVLETNGSIRTPKWWTELASIPNLTVSWSIDGLEDTNHLYRIGANYTKIIDNAKAFINAGGRATQKMILFKHNEHQVDSSINLAKEIGFRSFTVDQPRHIDTSGFRVCKKPGVVDYLIETPVSNRREIISFLPRLSPGDPYFNKPQNISRCPWLNMGKIYITADGYVIPCCMMHAVPTGKHNPELDYEHFIKLVGDINTISLEHYSLEEIINSKFFKKTLDQSLSDTKTMHTVCNRFCSAQIRP